MITWFRSKVSLQPDSSKSQKCLKEWPKTSLQKTRVLYLLALTYLTKILWQLQALTKSAYLKACKTIMKAKTNTLVSFQPTKWLKRQQQEAVFWISQASNSMGNIKRKIKISWSLEVQRTSSLSWVQNLPLNFQLSSKLRLKRIWTLQESWLDA